MITIGHFGWVETRKETRVVRRINEITLVTEVRQISPPFVAEWINWHEIVW